MTIITQTLLGWYPLCEWKVLIGCDGVNSLVSKWLGLKKAAFTGRCAIRGCVDFKQRHGFGPKFMQFHGKGFRSGFIPCDDQIMYWFFTWTPSGKGLPLFPTNQFKFLE